MYTSFINFSNNLVINTETRYLLCKSCHDKDLNKQIKVSNETDVNEQF